MSEKRTLLGVLTPSSNTALEPLTSALVAGIPNVSAHFARFKVTEISLAGHALAQFDYAPILEAARLLADARVDVIGWSGTAGGWLGFEQDRELCRRIEDATGVRATTSILALNEVMERLSVSGFGLVSPYVKEIQDRIVRNYSQTPYPCLADSRLDIRTNFDFSLVDEATLTEQVLQVARSRPDAICTYCTNLKAAHLVERWEADTGIPVLDTTTVVVWKMLRMAGFDTLGIRGWGRLFQEAN
jgi:maleate isomerase